MSAYQLERQQQGALVGNDIYCVNVQLNVHQDDAAKEKQLNATRPVTQENLAKMFNCSVFISNYNKYS